MNASLIAVRLVLLSALISGCSLPGIIIPRDPLTPEEHLNLGVTYEKHGEADAALREYETASRELPLAYLYMGNAFFQKNDLKRAEKAYRKAIEKTGDPRAYNNLAWLYYNSNQKLDEAEVLAKKAVELSPGSQDFLDTLEKVLSKRRGIQEEKKTTRPPAASRLNDVLGAQCTLLGSYHDDRIKTPLVV
jgi:tetratricopeptide (TPR) repeat protein